MEELGGRRAALAWGTLWLVVAALVVLPYAHSYRHLSPFDEMVHVDYLVKLEHGQLVRAGDKVGPVAAHEEVCRGIDIPSPGFPRCRPRVDVDRLPGEGYSTAYSDPPLYYGVTGVLTWVTAAVPGVDDTVTAARSVGVLWLAGGLLVTCWLALAMGASRVGAAGATLLVASAPTVAHASATVTSDAALLVTGAGLCLVALRVMEGRLAWWWLVPAAAVAAAAKATSLTVIGLVVLYLLLHLLPGRATTAGRRSVWLSVAATLAGGGAVLGGWALLSAARATMDTATIPQNELLHVDSLQWTVHIAPNIYALFSPLQNAYLPPFINGWTLVLPMLAVNVLLQASLLAVAWMEPRSADPSSWAIATLLAMLAGGTGLVLFIFVGTHTSIAIPPRYGLSMVPAAAGCLAVAAGRSRAGGYALVGLGGAALAAMVILAW